MRKRATLLQFLEGTVSPKTLFQIVKVKTQCVLIAQMAIISIWPKTKYGAPTWWRCRPTL